MASAGATFAAEVRAWAEKAKARPETTIRQFMVNLTIELLERTPVGDPSLWKKKTPPPGYVGGALRANWNFTLNVADESNVRPPNRSVPDGIDRLNLAIAPPITDQAIYLVNAQPYARRVEFEGWSHLQEPLGMVRVTAVQADEFMAQAIRQTSQ